MATKARPTAWGQVVRTADGTICHVRSIYRGEGEQQMADLTTIEGGEELALPVAELTRIPDPRNRLPAVEGIPDGPRPRCQRCDRAFAWIVDHKYAGPNAGPLSPRVLRRVFVRWSSYRGLFCTLSCALAFAELAHKAGYRMVRPPASPKGPTT